MDVHVKTTNTGAQESTDEHLVQNRRGTGHYFTVCELMKREDTITKDLFRIDTTGTFLHWDQSNV